MDTSQDPVYLLFWVLTADTTPHWVLVSNAVCYWSSRILSICPTIVRNRVLEFTRIATCYRKTAAAMPQEVGKFPCRDSYSGDWHRPAILSSVRRVAWSCVVRPLEKIQIATLSPAPWQPPTLSSESCMSNDCSRSRVIAHTTLIRFVIPPYSQSV